MLELVQGNLLEAQADALVNAVNSEGVMGKGIALQFKTRFPEMYLAYRNACQNGEVQPGRMHVFPLGEGCQPRLIINFPTKREWRSSSRMEDIESGLNALAEEIRIRGIRSIALPALGCGNGGLDWSEVYLRIKHALETLDNVRVLVFPPQL